MPAHPWILISILAVPAALLAFGLVIGSVSRRLWP